MRFRQQIEKKEIAFWHLTCFFVNKKLQAETNSMTPSETIKLREKIRVREYICAMHLPTPDRGIAGQIIIGR
jgi:hypothetical protein